MRMLRIAPACWWIRADTVSTNMGIGRPALCSQDGRIAAARRTTAIGGVRISGDKFRRFSITTVTDVGSALASIPDIPYQILTNPQGVIWGILYGPIGVVENAVGGFVCGDPEKLGHVASSYGLFVVGGVWKGLEKPPALSAQPKVDIIAVSYTHLKLKV